MGGGRRCGCHVNLPGSGIWKENVPVLFWWQASPDDAGVCYEAEMTDDLMLALAHTIVSSPGVLALLLGSGVSRASGIPTGWEVTLGLVRDLAALQGEDAGADPATWYRAATGQEPDYSALLEQLARATGERRNLLERFFEPTAEEREEGLKRPTEAHRVVARLMARGYVRVVLTTNFDRLLEDACAEEGVGPVVISSNDGASSAEPLVHQRHVIIKLHGDYKDPRIMNTTTELATYPPEMDKLLDQVLGEFGLVVCGWSGDWDAALRAAFKRVGHPRYSAFWASMTAPTGRGAAVADGRGTAIITIKDADAFFRELEEKVLSLEDLRAQRPSSPAIAVATLKRYLAEDRYRLRLQDLVHDEAVAVAEDIESHTFSHLTVSRVMLPEEVPKMDDRTAVLRSICFHFGRLSDGGEKQERLLIAALLMMAPPSDIFGVPLSDVGRRLRLYPMALGVHAAAYGALLTGNFRLLRSLLMLEFTGMGQQRVAFLDLCPVLVLQEPLAKQLQLNRKFPAAEHIMALLTPLAQGYTQEPEDLFHQLEMWFCLAACERRVRNDYNGYVPIGRFTVSSHIAGPTQPQEMFLRANRDGDAWPPFAAGWLGGSLSGAASIRALFDTIVGEVSARNLF